MKAKSLLIALTLSMLISSQSLVAGDYLETTPVGAAIGYAAGWAAQYAGVERVASMPGISHILKIATPEEREFLMNHLPELGAFVGACIATGNSKVFFGLTKVTLVIDFINRVQSNNWSTESMAYMLRDVVGALEGFVPTDTQAQVPGWESITTD